MVLLRRAALLIRCRSTGLHFSGAAPHQLPRVLAIRHGSYCTSTGRTATAEQVKTQGSRGTRRPGKPQGAMARASSVLWRGVYTLFGAAIAGSGVLYVTDPAGTKQMVQDFKESVDEKIRFFTEPSREKLLPDARPQYPGGPAMRTLIIDLDETLIHSAYTRSTGWKVAKRPGAEAFLAYLCSFYEIVIFTSGLDMYGNPILDRLDPNGYIQHRLYRPETKYEKGVHVKDLTGLNRDLSRVIAIDHDLKNIKYHQENAIKVPKWTGDPTDTTLLDLIPFLETLVKEDVTDVREHLAVLRNKSIKEGIADHSANASARLEKEQERKGIFFGSSASTAPPPPVEDAGSKGAAWSSLTRTSKLFHPDTTVEIPEEAKELQKRA